MKYILLFLLLLSSPVKADYSKKEILNKIKSNVEIHMKIHSAITDNGFVDGGIRINCYHRCMFKTLGSDVYMNLDFSNTVFVAWIIANTEMDESNLCIKACNVTKNEEVIKSMYQIQ